MAVMCDIMEFQIAIPTQGMKNIIYIEVKSHQKKKYLKRNSFVCKERIFYEYLGVKIPPTKYWQTRLH